VPIGNRRLIDLLHGLTAPDLGRRESSCGTVTDWATAFRGPEAMIVGASQWLTDIGL
jgi:hypothetical protein